MKTGTVACRILMKSLPNCRKGSIFKQNIVGEWYNYMTDDEHIAGDIHRYKFTNGEVLSNIKWFSDIYEVVIKRPDDIV